MYFKQQRFEDAAPVGVGTFNQDGLDHGPEQLLQTTALRQTVAWRVNQHGPQGFLSKTEK